MKKELMGLKEAAEILDVSYTFLDKMARKGKVPGLVRMGNRRKLSYEAIKKIQKEGIK